MEPLQGSIDEVTHSVLSGWAWDKDHPNEPVVLQVFDNGTAVMKIVANRYREHLEKNGIGDGRHSFYTWFVGGLSPFGTSGAETLIDSVNSVGARFAAAAARSTRIRFLEVIPLADAVTLPTCPLLRNVVVVSAFHGELLGDPAALRAVRGFLDDRPVKGLPGLRTTAEIMAAAASAWRMPEHAPPSPPCRS